MNTTRVSVGRRGSEGKYVVKIECGDSYELVELHSVSQLDARTEVQALMYDRYLKPLTGDWAQIEERHYVAATWRSMISVSQ